MNDRPFKVLMPHAGDLTTALFAKADDIWRDADAARAIGATQAAGLHQIHGGRVIVVRAPTNRVEQADGMITDVPGLTLCTRWADCQNFVVYAPDRHVVGVIHAGWRGILAGVIPEFFRVLNAEWGIEGKDVLVGAGPSLCVRCSEFTDPRTELPGFPSDLIDGRTADLRAAADRQFASCGVPLTSLERHADCTRCAPDRYWTYRGGHRDEVKAGHTNMLACVLRGN